MIIQKRKGDLIHTYSDRDLYVHGGYPEADYAVAIDPVSAGRVYVETNRKIELSDPPENFNDSIEYLVNSKVISVYEPESEPDYLNENEEDPNYFN